MLEKLNSLFSVSYDNDEKRKDLMFKLANIILCLVALTMTVINIGTKEIALMVITAVYALLCILNFILYRKFKKIISIIFIIESFVLFGTFIITGIPEGFSVLWVLLVPACALSIFKILNGSLYCFSVFLLVINMFWTPWGRALLVYDYSETFMLRFPFVYAAVYVLSLYLEYIRVKTLEKLKKTEEKYRYLSRHDALTGMYNRYAFNDELKRIYRDFPNGKLSAILFDIDNFKQINDQYGHSAGDDLLCCVAEIIRSSICEHCVASRWGGEEFLIVMRCQHDPCITAEKIRREIEDAYIEFNGEKVSCTVSAGVYTGYSDSIDDIEAFVNKADKAMYESKVRGKNKVTIKA